jgi:rhodanese-related sulfurtransferase
MRLAALTFLIAMFACVSAYSHTDRTPTQVIAMLADGGEYVVVDVREEWEFCDNEGEPPGHIIGSINMPWDSGYFQAHYGELAPDQNLIMVCLSNYRSNLAARFLDMAGYTAVFDMLGGMHYWEGDTESCDSAVEPGTWSAIKALYR